MGQTLYRLGSLQVATGSLDEGELTLRRALSIQQRLAGESNVATLLLDLSQTETALAGLLVEFTRLDEATILFEAAVSRQQKLMEASSKIPVYRLGLARTLEKRATMFGRLGRIADADADTVRAFELIRKLADDFPHRPDYRLQLAAARHNHAQYTPGPQPSNWFEVLDGRYAQSIAEHEQIAAEFPDLIENHQRLAVSLNSFATWLDYRSTRAAHWGVMAVTLMKSAHLHRRSEEIWKKLMTEHPNIVAYQNGLAVSHQRRGIILERMGFLDEAERGYREAIAIQSALAQKHPTVVRHQIMLAGNQNNLGVVFDRRKDSAGAERHFRLSIEHSRKAIELNPTNPTPPILLFTGISNLCEKMIDRRDHAAVAHLIPELVKLKLGIPTVEYRPLFEFLERCVQIASHDVALSTAERAACIRRYEDLTIDFAKALASKGTVDRRILRFLETHPSLNHARHRNEFQAIILNCRMSIEKTP